MELERVKERIMEGRPGFPREYGPARRDHQPGIPLFPQEATRDLVVIFLLTAIMFFLSSYLTPFLGPARSPQISELIVPDWYLLFSWGLLKVADIFTSSLYSIREVISERWLSPNGATLIPDNTQKWFFVIPPILVGLVTYTALRRLGYQPMRRWLVPNVTVPAIIVCAQSAAILLLPGWLGTEALPYVVWIAA